MCEKGPEEIHGFSIRYNMWFGTPESERTASSSAITNNQRTIPVSCFDAVDSRQACWGRGTSRHAPRLGAYSSSAPRVTAVDILLWQRVKLYFSIPCGDVVNWCIGLSSAGGNTVSLFHTQRDVEAESKILPPSARGKGLGKGWGSICNGEGFLEPGMLVEPACFHIDCASSSS